MKFSYIKNARLSNIRVTATLLTCHREGLAECVGIGRLASGTGGRSVELAASGALAERGIFIGLTHITVQSWTDP